MKYLVKYIIMKEIDATDRRQARRFALQDCPDENAQVAVWEIDENGNTEGRVM